MYDLYQKQKLKNCGAILLQIVSFVGIVASIILYTKIPNRIGYQSLFWIPSCFTVLAFSCTDEVGISKVFNNKICQVLGNISFTFYMIHQLGIRVIDSIFFRIGADFNGIFMAVLQFFMILIASLLVNYFFEKPINKILSKKLGIKK